MAVIYWGFVCLGFFVSVFYVCMTLCQQLSLISIYECNHSFEGCYVLEEQKMWIMKNSLKEKNSHLPFFI